MFRSKLSCGIAAAISLACIPAAQPAMAAGGAAGLSRAHDVFASLLGIDLKKALLEPTAKSTKVASASGSVTTATRVLDLNALHAADFGDEPSTAGLR